MTEDRPWIIRRTHGASGNTLARPVFWGRIVASSESVAVQKFVNLLRSGDNVKHFDAIPGKQ